MKATGLLAVALAATLAAACNGNREGAANEQAREETGIGTGGDVREGADGDVTEWAARVAHGGMAEIELGQMAQQKGQHPDVKAFGEMMVRDHTRSSNEFKQIASQHSIPLPSQLDERHAETRDRLSQLNGREFDREYMNAMVQGHQDMVDVLQARANEDRIGDDRGQTQPENADNARDQALNQFAAKSLPTVRQHLEQAERVRDAVNGEGTNTRR